MNRFIDVFLFSFGEIWNPKTVLLSSKPSRTHLQIWLQAHGVWDCNHMGWCLAVKHASLWAQNLQPFHLQLSLICSKLSQQALLWWINELEHDKCSSADTGQGALGWWLINHKVISSLRCGTCPWHLCSWVAVPYWSSILLFPPPGLVSSRHLLCQKLVRVLVLLVNNVEQLDEGT